jgi:hypothetical protein
LANVSRVPDPNLWRIESTPFSYTTEAWREGEPPPHRTDADHEPSGFLTIPIQPARPFNGNAHRPPIQEQLPSQVHGLQQHSCVGEGAEAQRHPHADNMPAINTLPTTTTELFIFDNPFPTGAFKVHANYIIHFG